MIDQDRADQFDDILATRKGGRITGHLYAGTTSNHSQRKSCGSIPTNIVTVLYKTRKNKGFDRSAIKFPCSSNVDIDIRDTFKSTSASLQDSAQKTQPAWRLWFQQAPDWENILSVSQSSDKFIQSRQQFPRIPIIRTNGTPGPGAYENFINSKRSERHAQQSRLRPLQRDRLKIQSQQGVQRRGNLISPGPGDYQIQDVVPSKFISGQPFSLVDRFPEPSSKDIPGVGTYDLPIPMKKIRPNTVHPHQQGSSKVQVLHILEHILGNEGQPESLQVESTDSMKNRKSHKKGQQPSHQFQMGLLDRFGQLPQERQPSQGPGPGTYEMTTLEFAVSPSIHSEMQWPFKSAVDRYMSIQKEPLSEPEKFNPVKLPSK